MIKLTFIFSWLAFTQVFAETITFDLGGSCMKEGWVRDNSLQYNKKLRDAKKNQQWDILIDEERLNVREDCGVPANWVSLFQKVVEAKRYKEAVGVLNEAKKRGMKFPHSLVDKTDKSFLESEDFTKSELGIQFLKEKDQIQKLVAEAKVKIDLIIASEKPPEIYFAEGACPFECCQYGVWKTREIVKTFSEVRSSKPAMEIPAGVEVKALTGKVVKAPEPYVALESRGIVKQGDILFMLDYFGEGGINFWYKGKLSPDLKTEFSTENFYENDQANSEANRWLKKIHPEKKFADEWWAQLKSKDGRIGWIKPDGKFEGTDGCGH